MEYFDYQVGDENSGKILRAGGLPMVLMSIAAMKVIDEQHRLSYESNDTKFLDCAATSRNIVTDILQNESFAEQQDVIAAVTAKILSAIDTADADAKSSRDSGNHIGAINDFYQSITNTLIDDLEVVKDEYKPTSATDGTMRHEAVIKITHDSNEWVFKVVDLDDSNSPYDVTVNGMIIGDITTSDRISSDARWVGYMLSSLVLQMVYEMQAAQRVNSMLGNPDIVKKSKGIAKVLGGDYENYLHIVSEFDAEIKRGLASGEILEDDIMTDYMTDYTIKRNPNITKEQVKEIVDLFKSKSAYH